MLLQKLVSTEIEPGGWLKICAPFESVSQLLPNRWNVHEPEFLMSADLTGGCSPAPEGYRVYSESAGSLAFVRLIADSGEIAVSGQVAIDGSFATFDKIVTAETHRRKGLGRYIMTALSNISLDLGARQGVLVATVPGAALYKATGWSLVSPVTAASFPQERGKNGVVERGQVHLFEQVNLTPFYRSNPVLPRATRTVIHNTPDALEFNRC